MGTILEFKAGDGATLPGHRDAAQTLTAATAHPWCSTSTSVARTEQRLRELEARCDAMHDPAPPAFWGTFRQTVLVLRASMNARRSMLEAVNRPPR